MGADSKIGWTDHTFNPWIGCTKVDELCAHCYAEALMDTRYGRVEWGLGKPRSRTSAAYLKQPLKWNREAANEALIRKQYDLAPYRPRVFCASLADWLDDDGVPIEWLCDLLALIKATPNLDWLLLTKRPQLWSERLSAVVGMRVADDSRAIDQCSGIALAAAWLNGAAPENVWIGTSVGTQKGADERIPQLLAIPARVRFLSCEPLLENLSLERARIPDAEGRAAGDAGIHWVICGTESGQRRRTMNLDWARSLRDQCKAAGVAFFLKQIEECGKIVTEPTLDGVQHLEFPQ